MRNTAIISPPSGGLEKCSFSGKRWPLYPTDARRTNHLRLLSNRQHRKKIEGFSPLIGTLNFRRKKGRLPQNSRPKVGGYTRYFSVRMPENHWYYWVFQKVLYRHSYHFYPRPSFMCFAYEKQSFLFSDSLLRRFGLWKGESRIHRKRIWCFPTTPGLSTEKFLGGLVDSNAAISDFIVCIR